jgi:hypothetical protein
LATHQPKLIPTSRLALHQADQVVGASGTEDLPVAGVVADEGDVGEDDRQIGGGHQLPPGVLQGDEGGSSGGEQDEVEADLGGVVPVPAVKQTGLLDLAGQLGVLTPASRPRRRRPGGQLSVQAGQCTLPPIC